jgi:small GTP-binding protein
MSVIEAIVGGEITVVDGKPHEKRKPVKVILLGDTAVGKSKLVERFLMQRYLPIKMSTYALTLFKYDFQVRGRDVDVDLWDTAGQERFATMHPAYYHEAQCCILVFSAENKQSYKNLPKWFSELRGFRQHIPCLVACNKIDTDPEIVNNEFSFASKNDLPVHFVSAAEGTNVVQLFRSAIAAAVAYRDNPNVDDVDTQVLSLLKEQIAAAAKEQDARAAALAAGAAAATAPPGAAPVAPAAPAAAPSTNDAAVAAAVVAK